MNRLEEKRTRLARRKDRVRFAIRSRKIRPRLVFNRSNRFLAVQLIDDVKGVTLCQANTMEESFKSGSRKNKDAAKKLGALVAERIVKLGIKQVVLDRRGLLYHGRLAEFADAAREKGLEF